MIFRIVDFNKELDIYSVISNEGEQKNVTSFQIVNVMLQGYQFDNAYLTQKGFAVKTNNGTRYFQVNMDKRTQMLVMQFLTAKKLQEQQLAEQQRQAQLLRQQQEAERLKQQQEAERLRKEQEQKIKKQQSMQRVAATVSPSTSGKATKIQGNNRNEKIFYRGNLYYSVEQLCKKFNADAEQFRKLRVKGYSIDEALGLKPLRPEEELVSLKQLNRVLDSMAAQRGEF